MSNIKMIIILAVLGLTGLGCTHVMTAAPTTEDVNGDVWYVKWTMIFQLPVAAKIFYCPKPNGTQPASCQQAVIIDNDDSGKAAPADYNEGFGAQTGFGTPQGTQPQYGAPMQPGMQQQPGMPAQPGMQQPGMPAQPGMQQQPGMPAQPGMQQPGMPAQPGVSGSGDATYGL